jgi:fibronectin-binding autotransporter adhesin
MASGFFVTGGTGNWNSNTNWSATSGGASGASFPTVADDVTFDSHTANITINVASACLSLTVTSGYTNTFAMTSTLTVSGNVSLGANMLFSGANALIINAASSMTSNGCVLSIPLTLNGGVTYTLVDDWNVNALCTLGVANLTQTINRTDATHGTLIFQKSATFTGNGSAVLTGTSLLKFTGTGTWTYNSITCKSNITIACGANTLTFAGGGSGVSLYNTGTITFVSGTWGSATNNISINGSMTIDSTGYTTAIPINFIVNTSSTITLSSDLYLSGNLTNSSGTLTINGNNLYLGGNLTQNSTLLTGTTVLIFNGTSTWSSSGPVRNNLTINTSGVVTFSGSIAYNTGTFTYTAGTIVNTSSTLLVALSTTFNTSGTSCSFNNLSVTATATLTLNSLLSIVGTYTTNVSVTYAGTSGFTANTWTSTTAGLTHTLVHAVTYTVTNSLTLTGTSASHITILSDSAGTKALLVMSGLTQAISFITATDVDSGPGYTIWCWSPTLSNTSNWNSLLSTSVQSAYTYVN